MTTISEVDSGVHLESCSMSGHLTTFFVFAKSSSCRTKSMAEIVSLLLLPKYSCILFCSTLRLKPVLLPAALASPVITLAWPVVSPVLSSSLLWSSSWWILIWLVMFARTAAILFFYLVLLLVLYEPFCPWVLFGHECHSVYDRLFFLFIGIIVYQHHLRHFPPSFSRFLSELLVC